MKFTILFTSTTLVALSSLVSGAPFVDHTDLLGTVYVNPNGEVVLPEEYPWGRYVMKEKDAAKNRTCIGHSDPESHLGKRQAYCPYGFVLACDAYSASPCCPSDTPVCCSAGTVCCASGQFCQGTSTCCNAGQIGCGEGCCSFGETCCGDKCCGAGLTCDNGTCNTPPNYNPPTYSYVPPTSTTSISSSTSSTSSSSYIPPTYGPGYTRTIVPSYSNPYPTSITYSIPSYTIPPIYTSPPGPTCDSSNNGGGNPPKTTVIGATVGSILGAFTLLFAGISAWLYRRNRALQSELAACKPTPAPAPPVEEPKPAYQPTPTPPAEEPAYVGNENSYVERPITGTPGLAGHGNNYT